MIRQVPASIRVILALALFDQAPKGAILAEKWPGHPPSHFRRTGNPISTPGSHTWSDP